MKRHNVKTPIKSIFWKDGSYWKITGYSSAFVGGIESRHYTVIKCTKTGKLFKTRTVFPMEEIDGQHFWASESDEIVTSASQKIVEMEKRISELETDKKIINDELDRIMQKLIAIRND